MKHPESPDPSSSFPQNGISPNRLISEKSPYLLQHAGNPVDWYPWGGEAFQKAERENKPIFLSVGYSTCHWCHVMARESFEDSDVARILNESFVCIKVDREERPDVDAVYMAACQLMTGSGGWPLTIILTPTKKPLFAATYLPRERRSGTPGILDILPLISALWKDRRDEMLSSSEAITSLLIQPMHKDARSSVDPDDISVQAFENLERKFDPLYGGFGRAPKFPSPHILMFLLRYWKRTGSSDALTMVMKTLAGITSGGITDQVGGGIHRYSTDGKWRIPHFEKMLYDQAMFTLAATEAYLATGAGWCRSAAAETISYVLRDLVSSDGAFYSAEDADIGGREGAYYLWDFDGLIPLLGSEDASLAQNIFHLSQIPVSTGSHSLEGRILYRTLPEEDPEMFSKDDTERLEARIHSIRHTMLESRALRTRPARDEKILVGWNGLMIAALARAGWAMHTPEYSAAAVRAADFILSCMRMNGGGLFRRFFHGEAGIPGFAEDYAGFIFGLTELYEATFDERYLTAAVELMDYLIAHFEDRKDGGIFTVSDNGEPLLVRQKELYDGAYPSPNSLSFSNLLRLYQHTGYPRFESASARMLRTFTSMINENPDAYTFFLCGFAFAEHISTKVVIAGSSGKPDTETMINACRQGFRPSLILMLRDTGENARSAFFEAVDGVADYIAIGGKATAYLCTGTGCSAPVTEPGELIKMLDRKTAV